MADEAFRSEILAALSKITSSQAFLNSARLSEFLKFVVEASLAGDTSLLKETSIGIGLIQRDCDYDPKLDSIVRTQARRVRQRLEQYYMDEGAADQIVIQIPKGSYAPIFERRKVDPVPQLVPQVESRLKAGARPDSWTWKALAMVGLACAALLATYIHYSRPGNPSSTKQNQSFVPLPRIAVLPFRGSEAGSENDLYGHAMADSIMASLARINDLTILGSVESDGSRATNPASDLEVAAKMAAKYAITGRFTKNGDQSRISLKLSEVSNGGVIWSRTYNFPWSNLTQVEAAMSAEVTARTSQRLGEKHSAAVRSVPPSSQPAYQEFLAGYYAAVTTKQSVSLTAFLNAQSHLTRALELDSGYPDAHATLAGLLLSRVLPWTPDSASFLSSSENHAKAALERAPHHPEALAALARCNVLHRRPREALGFARKALEAEPGNIEALSALANMYESLGFWESALDIYKQCARKPFVALEPFLHGAIVAAQLGRFDEAEEFIRAHAAVDPDSVLHITTQGFLLQRMGEHAAAEAKFRQVHQDLMARDVPMTFKKRTYIFAEIAIALALAKQGKLDSAHELINRMGPPVPRLFADEILLLSLAGHSKAAIAAIDGSYLFRNYRFLVTEPDLKPLYGDAGFKNLLEKMYPEWVALRQDLEQTLPSKPPMLPSPAEFLRAHQIR